MRGIQFNNISAAAALAAAFLFAFQGCQEQAASPAKPIAAADQAKAIAAAHEESAKKDDHAHHHHDHAEKGPHGGTLVALGDEAAHVELVLDAETGKLSAWVLDGAAKEPVAIKQAEIKLAVGVAQADAKKGDLPESHEVALAAINPTAEGEASEFAGQADNLMGAKEFHVVLPAMTIGDKKFEPVEFKYPEGNEHDHHHH